MTHQVDIYEAETNLPKLIDRAIAAHARGTDLPTSDRRLPALGRTTILDASS